MGASSESSVTRPEHALLLAATGVGDSARDAVARALSSPLDWTRVVELTLRHRMAPALLIALEPVGSLVPPELLAALRAHCATLREQSTALVRELLELLDALDLRSVSAIPFKGPLLGELLFGDAGLRPPGDLDILVRPADVPAVCEILEARGYADADRRPGVPHLTTTQQRMYQRFQCEYRFIRESDGTVVEPHWGLSQRPLAIDVDYPGMLDRARPAAFKGRPVLSLAPADLLLALCIHGAKHRWERLTWIHDIAALLRVHPELDLDASIAAARGTGCKRILLLGLALAHECAEVPLSSAVTRAIEADGMTAALGRDVMEGLFGPLRPEPRNDRIDCFRLEMRERWSDRARYVTRTWTAPRRYHIETVALPSSLRWIYPPLKVVLDYAVLPLWHLARSDSRWAK